VGYELQDTADEPDSRMLGSDDSTCRGISSDDRRYLRKRKMELDEAMFNASQEAEGV
jgi:hypothetical protein